MITPGKWKAAEISTQIDDYYCCRVFALSDAEIAPANGYGSTPKEAQDNARLIAASPDLLKVCKGALEAATVKAKTYRESAEKQAEIVAQLEAAIANAE